MVIAEYLYECDVYTHRRALLISRTRAYRLDVPPRIDNKISTRINYNFDTPETPRERMEPFELPK